MTSKKCDLRAAARLAATLFGCYPRNDANNPEVFLAGATAMLASYPEAIAAKVCDPIRGLPGKNKFLPSIAEIREACEREMVWHDTVERRDRERAHTARVLAGHKAPVGSPEHQRVVKSFAQLGEALEARQKADPLRPKPFTLVLEEGRDAFAERGPPKLGPLAASLRAAELDRYDEEVDDDREFLP